MITVAIASGKGGTGKTTLSTNLAEYVAENRLFQNIILADLDVEEPDSGLFLHSDNKTEYRISRQVPEWNGEKCTSCGLCDSVCNFNALLRLGNDVLVMPELCHSCFACSGLCPAGALPMKDREIGTMSLMEMKDYSFIEGRLDIGQEQAVPMISASLEYIYKSYPDDSLLIIDSPPGSSCPVLEVARNSEYVILVTEPTPFGFHDLKLAAEAMAVIGRKTGVVINKYGLGDNRVEQYCREREIEIISRIPNMRKIAELYSSGSLIYRSVPEFRKAIGETADFIRKASWRKG